LDRKVGSINFNAPKVKRLSGAKAMEGKKFFEMMK
jgi:hypothetical protein